MKNKIIIFIISILNLIAVVYTHYLLLYYKDIDARMLNLEEYMVGKYISRPENGYYVKNMARFTIRTKVFEKAKN